MAKVLVGVTGGIAAYKAPGVIRRLREAGHEVRAIATEAAFRFIPEETLSIAAGEHVHTDETWWEHSGRVEHVALARWADLVLVAPATADAMARAAIGLGDDLLSATILAGAKKVLWAPAMNPEMWRSPATRRNVETLKSWGHHFVGPAEGRMASEEEEPGTGRLAEEAEISRSRLSSFSAARAASTTAAPREASSLDAASPMPLEAPVTTATLPWRVCCTVLAIVADIR